MTRIQKSNHNKKILATPCSPLSALYVLSLLLLSGCGPTYPAAEVPYSIEKICREEYNLTVKAKVVGKTVGVYIPLDSLVDSSLRLSPEVGDKIDNATMVVDRVAFSTDCDLSFYVITASDTKEIGAELTLIGYIQDVKRVNLLDIPRSEYRERVIRDLKLNPKALGDKEGLHFQLAEISLVKFLAEQTSRRIESHLQEEGKKVESVKWELRDGKVEFTIDSTFEETAVSGALEIIAHVFHGYKFEDFHAVEITTSKDGRKLTVNKTDLELFKQKKISFSKIMTNCSN